MKFLRNLSSAVGVAALVKSVLIFIEPDFLKEQNKQTNKYKGQDLFCKGQLGNKLAIPLRSAHAVIGETSRPAPLSASLLASSAANL